MFQDDKIEDIRVQNKKIPLATSEVYAGLIHPEAVEVEAVVVRDPEAGATANNRTRNQQSKRSRSR